MTPIEHVPFKQHIPNSQTVLLFIHGILESPNQFKEFSRLANELNLSTYALLLPGHGSDGQTFAKTNRTKWTSHVRDTLTTLRQQYQHIILVGHSMGTLLAFDAYVQNSLQIKAMMVIASPLSIRCTFRGARCGLNVVLKRINKEDVYTVSMLNSYSVHTEHYVTYLKWVPRYLDLFTLLTQSRKHIKKIEVPVLVVHCHQDEFVSKRSLIRLKKTLKPEYSKFLELQESGHFYYIPDELNQLHAQFTQFLKAFIQKADQS